MRTLLMGAAALALIPGLAAGESSVVYTFQDQERDETYDVFVTVLCTDCDGLATYNVALSGLDDSPLDPSTFVWEQATLSTTDAATGQAVGFTSGLLAAPVGADAYSATNSQFNNVNYLSGVGMEPIFVEGLVFPPLFDEPTIDLGVPTLLGQLTIPGANNLNNEEFSALLTPSAALFTGEGPTSVVEPDLIVVDTGRFPRTALEGCVVRSEVCYLTGNGITGPFSEISLQAALDGEGVLLDALKVSDQRGYMSALGPLTLRIENDAYGLFSATIDPYGVDASSTFIDLAIDVEAANQLPAGTRITADLIVEAPEVENPLDNRIGFQLTAVVGAVPEPATAGLVAAGILAACGRRR